MKRLDGSFGLTSDGIYVTSRVVDDDHPDFNEPIRIPIAWMSNAVSHYIATYLGPDDPGPNNLGPNTSGTPGNDWEAEMRAQGRGDEV